MLDAAPLANSFSESYDPAGRTSGNLVVGLRLGPAHHRVDPDRVVLPIGADEGVVCVRAVTQDARFLMRAAYAVPASGAGGAIRLAPFSRSYGSVVAGYDDDRVAILAFAAPTADCDADEAIYRPQVDRSAGPGEPTRLTVFVNSRGSRVSAALRPDGATDGTEPVFVPCEPAGGGARVAYDVACGFDAAAHRPGVHRLVLRFDDAFETHVHTKTIRLPAVSPGP